MTSIQRLLSVCAAGLLLAGICGLPADATSIPGLVTIVSPGLRVSPPPGSTQAAIHLEVSFGQGINGAVANPLTFKCKKFGKISLLDPLTKASLWQDVKDAGGNVVGKQVDVTVPVTPGVAAFYKMSASVASQPLLGKVYKDKQAIIVTVKTNGPPTARLVVNPSAASFRYPVTFDARDSTDPDNDPLTYTFTFGDGSAPVTGTNPVVTHTYVSTGPSTMTYTVTLHADDGNGGTSDVNSSVFVHTGVSGAPMMTMVTPLNGEVVSVAGNTLPITINLGKASTGADPDLSKFTATLNGVAVGNQFTQVKDLLRGNLVTALQASISTSSPSIVHMDGTGNVLALKLISFPFTTISGGVRTITGKLSVTFTATTVQPPTAVFSASASEVSVNDVVTFDASASSDPQGKTLTYAWDFGDGNTLPAAPAAVVTHTYGQSGSYVTKLTVSDGTYNVTTDNSANPILVRDATGGGTPTLTMDPTPLALGDLDGSLTILTTLNGPDTVFPAWEETMVKITNSGTGLLSVTSVGTDNPNFQVPNAAKLAGVKLAAGESYFVDVRFDPRPYTTNPVPFAGPGGPFYPPAANGLYQGNLTIATNGGSQTVPLSANVVTGPVSGSTLRLMRTDAVFDTAEGLDKGDQGLPDLRHFALHSGAVIDLGVVATTQHYQFRGVINQSFFSGTITGVDVLDDPGSNFSARLTGGNDFPGQLFPVQQSFVPGQSSMEHLAPNDTSIQVNFTPSNTGGPVRYAARLAIHTTSGDLIAGLAGVGVYDALFSVQDSGNGSAFEFKRMSAGNSTTSLGSTLDGLSPASLVVQNIGRKPGTVNATLTPIVGGAGIFALNQTSASLGLGQSATFTATFNAPATQGNYSAALKLDFHLNFEPPQYYLLHGYSKVGGTGSALGTSLPWYSFDGDDFNGQTRMLNLDTQGGISSFDPLDTLQDPFKLATLNPDGSLANIVGTQQYSNPDWSSLVMLNGTEYTIDGAAFGPYVATDPQLTAAAKTRLQSGPIYSGGILSKKVFLTGTNGNQDIRSDSDGGAVGTYAVDPIRLDLTTDNTLFYSEVTSSAFPAPRSIATALRWKNLGTGVGGTVNADVASYLGHPNAEFLDMRVIKTASGYRVFVVFDATSGTHQVVADMDLDASRTPIPGAVKELTGSFASGEPSATANNQMMAIDRNGFWYTSASIQNANGTSTLQVWKEDLHQGSSSYALFGQTTVPIPDADQGQVLVDNLGNVFMETNEGLCAFSPSAFTGYFMAGNTYYMNASVGDGTDTNWDFSDFNNFWLDK